MELGSEKGIKTSQWFPNEILHNEDLDFLSEQVYLNTSDFLALLAEQGKATGSTKDLVIAGLLLEWNNLLTSNLRVGAAVSYSGSYFINSEWGFQATAGEVFSVVVAKDQAIAVDAGGAQARYDTIEIRPKRTVYNSQSRSYKDPVTGLVTSSLTNTRIEYNFEFQILKGTEGAGIAPTHTAGWIKVAEVFVDVSASAIDQDDIKDVRDSATWTTEASGTKYKTITQADKVPILDAGNRYTAIETEGALQEIAGSGRTTETVKQNQDDIDALEAGKVNKSILTTIGDFFVRGVSIPERLAAGVLDSYLKGQGAGIKPIYEKLALRNTGIKIGSMVRTTAGDQVVTGIGFEPSVIIFFATDTLTANQNFSWGIGIVGSNQCVYVGDDMTFSLVIVAQSIYIRRSSGNTMTGKITTVSSDGFTITWTLAGTSEAQVVYLCLP